MTLTAQVSISQKNGLKNTATDLRNEQTVSLVEAIKLLIKYSRETSSKT